MPAGISIFCLSFFVAIAFQLVEIAAGVTHGFHPDSLHYVDSFHLYTKDQFFSISNFNNAYYYVVLLFDGNYEQLILLNQVVFALTNVILFKTFGGSFKNLKFIHYFILFLPYRLHLSAHVLKDSLVIISILYGYFCTIRFLPISFLVTIYLRMSVAPISMLVRFMPDRRIFVVVALGLFLMVAANVPQVAEFLMDRSEADMGGRDYFDVPLANATTFTEITLKTVFWPIVSKSGIFGIMSPHPVTLALAVEPLFFSLWALSNKRYRNYVLERGTIALAFIAILVNSFGAYYRYIYAFLILDYVLTVCANRRNDQSVSDGMRFTAAGKVTRV